MRFPNDAEVVLFQRSPDNEIIDRILEEALHIHGQFIGEILKLRFESQKKYYSCQYEECLKLLQTAIKTALECPQIPKWFVNDIAIDIRHVCGVIDYQLNRFSKTNLGQEYIDHSEEPVYYPYLDRQTENMYEEISQKYYQQLTVAPYTIHFGGLDKMCASLVNAFCIAEIHGSTL